MALESHSISSHGLVKLLQGSRQRRCFYCEGPQLSFRRPEHHVAQSILIL